MNLSNLIKIIQDIMRTDQGVDGDAQRIGQLTWLLFLKIFDDAEQEYELTPGYQSPLPEELRWRKWAADDEGITGDELLDFVNNRLFPTLQEPGILNVANDSRARMIFSLFDGAFNYMKSGTLLRQVINKLNEIDFNSLEERHAFNDLYETILRDLQSAGNSGEYYTPRPVTQFMTEILNPRLGETVLDPACGTGGFLVCATEHIRAQDVRSAQDRQKLQTAIRGIEKKSLPHMLCVTNLILHDIEIPAIALDNALSRRPYRDYGPKDQVDVILTNPPFGGNEETGIETYFPEKFRTRETADMFIALLMKLLKPNGRAALVLPDGFLFGEGVKTRLKEELIENFNLHTIVRLPNSVFAPYTSIATNLLFFENGATTQEVWYFEHPMPEGKKNYNKTNPIQVEEFDLEKVWWNDRVENEYAWRVSTEEIKSRNYNMDIKNPFIENGPDHDPSVLLRQLKTLQGEAGVLRDQIKAALKESLE